jgi:hypothetical protein
MGGSFALVISTKIIKVTADLLLPVLSNLSLIQSTQASQLILTTYRIAVSVGSAEVLRNAICQVSPKLPSIPSLASRYSYMR